MAKLLPLRDEFIIGIRDQWFRGSHPEYSKEDFLPIAKEWFLSTKLNNLQGVDAFTCQDVIHGCTHYIESLIIRLGWSGFQILTDEYAYYSMMGKRSTEIGNLTAGLPLIVSLPNWRSLDLRTDWTDVLRECERKKIPIHIDMAWFIVARDIELDLAHPCIESFAMSLSKYAMEWNRIGVRWSRQRSMDSVTIFNHHERSANTALTSAGAWIISQLPRDYAWMTYGDKHHDVCAQQGYQASRIIHAAHSNGLPVPLAHLLVNDIASVELTRENQQRLDQYSKALIPQEDHSSAHR